jgi:hypothetical protein
VGWKDLNFRASCLVSYNEYYLWFPGREIGYGSRLIALGLIPEHDNIMLKDHAANGK